jgi:hypothetical protein
MKELNPLTVAFAIIILIMAALVIVWLHHEYLKWRTEKKVNQILFDAKYQRIIEAMQNDVHCRLKADVNRELKELALMVGVYDCGKKEKVESAVSNWMRKYFNQKA